MGVVTAPGVLEAPLSEMPALESSEVPETDNSSSTHAGRVDLYCGTCVDVTANDDNRLFLCGNVLGDVILLLATKDEDGRFPCPDDDAILPSRFSLLSESLLSVQSNDQSDHTQQNQEPDTSEHA